MKTLLTFALLATAGTAFSQEIIEGERIFKESGARTIIDHDSNIVDIDPRFSGGEIGVYKYLSSHTNYPKKALEKGIEGKCYLKCVVSKKGKISNVEIIHGVRDCPECDAEAVRVISGMPDWAPGKENGEAVNTYVNFPVNFKSDEPRVTEYSGPEQPVREPEPEVSTYVEESAEFPGGNGAMKKYISENLVCPQIALEQGLTGKCYLQFNVSPTGLITSIKVVRGVKDCPECDAEAIRLIKAMPQWIPDATMDSWKIRRETYSSTL